MRVWFSLVKYWILGLRGSSESLRSVFEDRCLLMEMSLGAGKSHRGGSEKISDRSSNIIFCF
jgi:hypothetical protein